MSSLSKGCQQRHREGVFAEMGFILSFHQKTNYDGRHPAAGLQIWHHLPGRFCDVEAATGRWQVDNHEIPDPIYGIDRLDRAFWDPNDADTNHNMSDHTFSFTCPDTSNDFFHVNDGVEFSYNTNPSTWGSSGLGRQDPQSVKTTLFVRARPRDAQSIYVDVYPMPREEMLTPVNGDSVTVGGSPMIISWEHEFLNQEPGAVNVLDQVEIWFSPHNGIPHSYQHVGTANHADTGFSWYPTGESVTDQGKVKLVFNNDVNDRTTETILDGTVTVVGTALPWEALITPNGGEALYAGEPYDIQWTNFNGSDLNQVDLRVTTDGGNWQVITLSDSTFSTVDNVNVFPWTPDASLVGGQTRVKLICHFSGGLTSESISEADFSIYEITACFSEVGENSGVNYEGKPYAAVDLDYDQNGKPDMFVTLQSCEGCGTTEARSRLYQNDGSTSLIRFRDRTLSDFTGTSETRNESYGLSVADYDNDGDRDVFITHAEHPQLFNLENRVFTDVINDTTVFSPSDADLLAEGYCANWVDYDHDGDLDLYLGRAQRIVDPTGDEPTSIYPLFDTLFENRGSSTPFQEVGRSVGLVDSTAAGVTTSAVWADMDDNGYWDVVVSGASNSGTSTRMYQENPDHTFTEVANPFPASVYPDLVNSLQWVDIDRDNDLDLLMIRKVDPSYLLINNNGQLDESVTLNHDSSWKALTGRAFDYNLDGYPDVAMANGAAQSEPYLWQNLAGIPSFGDQWFLDVTAKVGLIDGAGLTQGVFANDFNDDGDLDLFLGRDAANGRIFQNESPAGTDAPINHWLGFDLAAAQSSNDMGATVTLTTSGMQPLGMQMIDPGSGRGSQQPHQLVFGLGDLDESVDVAVQWPSGRAMTFTVSPSQFDQLMTVTEPTTFSIDDPTVTFRAEVRPSSTNLDWVFTWETNHWTDPGSDIVDIEHVSGSGCPFTSASLQDGVTNGVTTRLYYQVDPATDEISYKHEVRWDNRPCVIGCLYRFSVESTLDTTSDFVPNTQTDPIRFKVCPSSI